MSYQRYSGLDKAIISNCIEVYEKAKVKHLSGWCKNTSKQKLPQYTALSSIKDEEKLKV